MGLSEVRLALRDVYWQLIAAYMRFCFHNYSDLRNAPGLRMQVLRRIVDVHITVLCEHEQRIGYAQDIPEAQTPLRCVLPIPCASTNKF
eukprot:3583925-Amphidinium_carterae.2